MAIVKSLLEWATQELRETSKSPRLDAELIFSHLSGLTKVEIISAAYEQVESNIDTHFRELIGRRKKYEPVAYITGKKEFYGINFEVSPSVLIPRPETEILVDLVLDKAKQLNRRISILDLGTGSGCLAIAIASGLSKLGIDYDLTAIDVDPDALALAARNADRVGLREKIRFVESDWFVALNSAEDRFDILVSNPPYVSDDDVEVSPETSYEPKKALYAGIQGLDSIRHLLLNCRNYLNNPGLFYCEMGYNHRSLVENLIEEVYNKSNFRHRKLSFSRDLAGLDRVFEIEL